MFKHFFVPFVENLNFVWIGKFKDTNNLHLSTFSIHPTSTSKNCTVRARYNLKYGIKTRVSKFHLKTNKAVNASNNKLQSFDGFLCYIFTDKLYTFSYKLYPFSTMIALHNVFFNAI